MGFSGKKWELIGDRGIYRNYGRYTLPWGLFIILFHKSVMSEKVWRGILHFYQIDLCVGGGTQILPIIGRCSPISKVNIEKSLPPPLQ